MNGEPLRLTIAFAMVLGPRLALTYNSWASPPPPSPPLRLTIPLAPVSGPGLALKIAFAFARKRRAPASYKSFGCCKWRAPPRYISFRYFSWAGVALTIAFDIVSGPGLALTIAFATLKVVAPSVLQ